MPWTPDLTTLIDSVKDFILERPLPDNFMAALVPTLLPSRPENMSKADWVYQTEFAHFAKLPRSRIFIKPQLSSFRFLRMPGLVRGASYPLGQEQIDLDHATRAKRANHVVATRIEHAIVGFAGVGSQAGSTNGHHAIRSVPKGRVSTLPQDKQIAEIINGMTPNTMGALGRPKLTMESLSMMDAMTDSDITDWIIYLKVTLRMVKGVPQIIFGYSAKAPVRWALWGA